MDPVRPLITLARVARDDMVFGGAFHRRFDDRRFWMKWRQPLETLESPKSSAIGATLLNPTTSPLYA